MYPTTLPVKPIPPKPTNSSFRFVKDSFETIQVPFILWFTGLSKCTLSYTIQTYQSVLSVCMFYHPPTSKPLPGVPPTIVVFLYNQKSPTASYQRLSIQVSTKLQYLQIGISYWQQLLYPTIDSVLKSMILTNPCESDIAYRSLWGISGGRLYVVCSKCC